MSVERFMAYAADFEKTYVDDDWTRLTGYFTEDATYRVENVPFAHVAEGRDDVLAAMRLAIGRFDRLCERKIDVVGEPRIEGDRITVSWQATYTRSASPPLQFSAVETAEFVGDRIQALADIYDDGAGAKIEAWMRDHGEGLDFSYA